MPPICFANDPHWFSVATTVIFEAGVVEPFGVGSFVCRESNQLQALVPRISAMPAKMTTMARSLLPNVRMTFLNMGA